MMIPTLFTLLNLVLPEVEAAPIDFNSNTAQTLDSGEWSIGVFGPVRYGINDSLELEIRPLAALMAPHIAIKREATTFGDWTLSHKHQVGYPTSLLNMLARPGIGGILAADSVIPSIVTLHNTVFLGKETDWGMMSTSIDIAGALSFGESNYTTIDAPYGYSATQFYQSGLAVVHGLNFDYFFTEKLGFRYSSKLWYFPTSENKWSVEERDTLLWQVSDKTQIQAGINIVVADYPYGPNWHILPAFDARWNF